MHRFVIASLFVVSASRALAQAPSKPKTFSRVDTLRGSNGAGRAWWDATFYDLHVRINPGDSSVSGHNAITYRVLTPAKEMQIDLQVPLVVDSIVQDGRGLQFRR